MGDQKSNIREKALSWYRKKYGKLDNATYCTKYYEPEESWPKKSVWWPQIPISAINDYPFINILCEALPGKNDFYHLKIPTKFLKENLSNFHTIGDKIVDFYLSTDSQNLFLEEKGKVHIDFQKFLINSI